MKTRIKVFACIAAAGTVVFAGLFASCFSSMYSEERHIQRITKRAEERFLGEGSAYTGLELYPIYTENDALRYALIEFEPQGFMYVYIRKNILIQSAHLIDCINRVNNGNAK